MVYSCTCAIPEGAHHHVDELYTYTTKGICTCAPCACMLNPMVASVWMYPIYTAVGIAIYTAVGIAIYTARSVYR